MTKLLTVKQAMEVRNVGRTTFYSEVNDGLLPTVVRLGGNAYIPEPELTAVMAARIGGQTDEQVKRLVRHLHLLRQERAAAVTAEVA